MKKLAIVGKGTAGVIAAAHFAKRTDYVIDMYYDPSIKPQSVGEGGNPFLTDFLSQSLGFRRVDLPNIDGTIKMGTAKIGWGNNEELHHIFSLSMRPAYHFSSARLQDYIIEHLGPRINLIPENANIDTLNADHILDCSGKPKSFEEFNLLNERDDSIVVNAAYVVQCKRSETIINGQMTLAIARPHGWVFVIPLTNRTSIGYMHNTNISSKENILTDIAEVIRNLKLMPYESFMLNFDSYYRKQNFTDRIARNGNSSFFLEPIEATSIWTMIYIHRLTEELWSGQRSVDECNEKYSTFLQQIESMLMFHYFAGSQFDSPFWKFAREQGKNNMRKIIKDPLYIDILEKSRNYNPTHIYERKGSDLEARERNSEYGIWTPRSWSQHLREWDLWDKIYEV